MKNKIRFVLILMIFMGMMGTVFAASPTVSSITPGDTATNVSIASDISATLTLPNAGSPINPSTLSALTVYLTEDGSLTKIPATLSLNGGGNIVTINPDTLLDINTTYRVTITSGLRDMTAESVASFTSTFTTGIAGATGPIIQFENQDWTTLEGLNYEGMDWVNTWLVFHKVQTGKSGQWSNLVDKPISTLRIRNTSATPLNITSLTISNLSRFTLPNGESSLTIPAGGFYDLQVQYISTSSGRGVEQATLTIQSNAYNSPTQIINLSGAHMQSPESNHELRVDEIVDAFGFATNVGYTPPHPHGGDSVPSAPIGEEVISRWWRRADDSLPVYVRNLATFHSCCSSTNQIELNAPGGGTLAHHPYYGQTLLSAIYDLSGPEEATWFTTDNFEVRINHRRSCEGCTLMHGVRIYPVRDPSGNIVPNAYFATNDGVADPPVASTNYDYNDNVFLLTNVRPMLLNEPTDVQITGNVSANPTDITDMFTYNLTVTNDSIFHAANTNLVINLSAGQTVNYVDNAACTVGSSSVTCNFGTMTPEEVINLRLEIQPTATGVATADATVSSSTVDTNGANNTVSLNTTVTNTNASTITVIKQSNPTSGVVFDYTGSLGSFQLTADGTAANTLLFSNLVPGSYTITEVIQANWSLTSVVCTGTHANTTNGVQVTLGSNEDVVCTFTNDNTNNAPIAVDDNANFGMDTTTVIDVLFNDSDTEGGLDPASVTITSAPSNGTIDLIDPTTGAVTYTPTTSYVGPDSFTYEVCDLGTPILCDTAVVSITVTPTNSPPVAADDPIATDEDTAVVIDVVANDSDVDGNLDATTVNVTSAPSHGTTSVDPTTGEITYTPATNNNTDVSFTYQICDDLGACDSATVNVTVNPVNDAPQPTNDSATTDEDVAVLIDVLANDTDLEGNIDPATVSIVTAPAHGTTSIDPTTGAITYTSGLNQNSSVIFVYEVCDTDGACNTGLVFVTINPINDPPVAVDDTINMVQDTSVDYPVADNDTDPDDNIDLSTVNVTSAPANGTTSVNTTNGEITYTPTPGYTGADSFIYEICDTNAACDTATVTVDVAVYSLTCTPLFRVNTGGFFASSVDSGPNWAPQSAYTIPGSNMALTLRTISNVPANVPMSVFQTELYDSSDALPNIVWDFTVAPGDYIINLYFAEIYITPSNVGTVGQRITDVSVEGVVPLEFTAINPFLEAGTDTALTKSYIATIADGSVTLEFLKAVGSNNHPSVSGIEIIPTDCTANVLPDAVDDSAVTDEDVAVDIDVLANDTAPGSSINPASINIVTFPPFGTLNINYTTGVITYTPQANRSTDESFTYQVCNTEGLCDTADVDVVVNEVNDPPNAVNDNVLMDEDTSVDINVLVNDTHPDNAINPADVTVTVAPAHGTTSVHPATGVITYTPALNNTTPVTFTYQVCDTDAQCDTADVGVTITPIDDPIVAVDDATTTDEDVAVVIDVLANDIDVDGDIDPASVMVTVTPTHGTTSINIATGAITYTPAADDNTDVTFTYEVCDTNLNCDTADVAVTINPTDDPVIAVDDAATTDEDSPVLINVIANDTDVDGNIDPTSVTVTVAPVHGTTNVDPVTGEIEYTSALNNNTDVTFTYEVCDTDLNCDTAVVTVTINPTDDPVIAVDDAVTTDEDVAVVVDVLANDTDVDGDIDPASVMVTVTPTHGTTSVNITTGAITYTPAANDDTDVTFTYEVCDTNLNCDTAVVTVTITDINDVPVAVDDVYSTGENTPITIPVSGVLANDTDLDGDALTAVLNTTTTNGTLTLNADGSFTYTPNAAFSGSDSFTYHANDGTADSNIATATINVSNVNDAPVAVDDAYSTDEDLPLIVPVSGVIANDTDLDGNTLTATVDTTTSNGTLTLNANGSFTYTPNADFNGVDTFTYHVNDGTVDSNIATVTITVNSINDDPVAVDDAYITTENTPITVPVSGVLVNDTDVDGDVLTAISDTTTSNGTLTLNTDGSFTYTPNVAFSGSDSFTYHANDGTVDSNIATVTITVTNVNDTPVAVDDAYSTDEDTPITVPISGVLVNDTDLDSDALTAVINTTTSNGTLALNANGSFTYTPDADFNGTDTFTYHANDGTVDSNIATVTITVNAINDAPVAVDDIYSTTENTPITVPVLGVLVNDTDVDGDVLTAISNTTTSNGTLTLNADGSFTYTPNAAFNGSDSFTYHANDGVLDSNIATVTINVSNVNDAPVAVDDAYSTNEDTPITVPVSGVLVNDTDIDGNILNAIVDTTPSNGGLALNANGSFTYTPNANFNGTDTFTYHANDGLADSNIATVTITVNPINDVPIAVNDTYSTSENTPITVPVSGVLINDIDVDGDALVAILDTTTSNGTLTLNANGSFTYTPNANFTGSDSFIYRVNDGTVNGNVASATINVSNVNDTPVAVDDAYSTDEDTPITVPVSGVLVNDTDVDGDALTAVIDTTTSNGSLTLNANGSFTYTPNANFNGSDSFTYHANDGTVDSNIATVTITVNAVNDDPVAVDDSGSLGNGGSQAVDVLANDSDSDGTLNPATVTIVTPPTNGTTSINTTTGEITYTHNGSATISDTLTYTVQDDSGATSNIATVTLTISVGNVAPTAVDDSTTVANAGNNLVNVLSNDSDSDGTLVVSTVTVVTPPTNGTATVDPGTGLILYAHNGTATTSDTFTYTVEDDDGATSNIATVTVTISPANVAPTAVDDSGILGNGGTLAVDVLDNDSDSDGTLVPATVTIVTPPTNGGTSINTTTGEITYTHNGTATTSDTFTYTVEDDDGETSNIATVTLTISAANVAPTAVDDSDTLGNGGSVDVDVLANDTDSDGTLNPATVTIVTPPTNGTTSINTTTGEITYTHNGSATTSDTLTYTVQDDDGDTSNIATVTLTISAGNVAPVAVDDSYNGTQNTVLNVPTVSGVLSNDTDADSDPLTSAVSTTTTGGTLILNADGSFDYTPVSGTTSDSFTYIANDGSDDSNLATVIIILSPVSGNTPPTAVDDQKPMRKNTTTSLNLITNDIDPDGDTLTIDSVDTTGTEGTVTVQGDNETIEFVPTTDFVGTTTFTYVVSDGNGGTDTATVTIRIVNSSNDDDDDDDEEQVLAESPIIEQSSVVEDPEIDVFDPALSKIGFLVPGQIGVNGERLEWFVTVTNVGKVPGYNVVVTDTLRSELRIEGVNINSGSASSNVSGQTVTVTIPVLQPGQRVEFSIITVVTGGGIAVDNTATVTADNIGQDESVTARVISALPTTGESPWSAVRPLILAIGSLFLVIGMGWIAFKIRNLPERYGN